MSEAELAAVERVLRSGWLTTGEECLKLEAELADYLGIEHVITMSSCTAALETALAHLELPAGTPVGVPTWTFASSALAAYHQGYQPVLVDIDPDSLNLSSEALSRSIAEDGLKAVVGVHFGGVALPESIHQVCATRGIPLIEDAAHALGSSDHRGLVNGQYTAGACFSFYATKNLTSGEGGALATDDEELAEFARIHRLHGLSKDAWNRYAPEGSEGYDVTDPGIKANLPDLLAALARAQLARFEELQARRRQLLSLYRDLCGTIDGLRFAPTELDERAADHLTVVVLPKGVDRSAVRAVLREAGVATSVHFQPLHTMTWFREHGRVATGGTPQADYMAPRALSLPLHPNLTDLDVERVCQVLADAIAQS